MRKEIAAANKSPFRALDSCEPTVVQSSGRVQTGLTMESSKHIISSSLGGTLAMARKVRIVPDDQFDRAVYGAEVKMMQNSIISSRRKRQGSVHAFRDNCRALLHSMAANEALYGVDGFSAPVEAK